jgi:SAM-dependent methyltransferase
MTNPTLNAVPKSTSHSGLTARRCSGSWLCRNATVIDPAQDAFGVALFDYLEGRRVPELVLEVKGGLSKPAMHPEWFFRSLESWDWWEREILPLVRCGPVLDLGAGAGRAALYFQQRGLPVAAVDASPGAVEVCRRQGIADVRLGDANDPPQDRTWAAVLLLCGNLGLGGSWEGNRRLLARLACRRTHRARSCLGGRLGDT